MKTKMHKMVKSSPRDYLGPVDICLPTLHLNESELPEVGGWKVGGEYMILLKVKQRGSHLGHKDQISANFDILEAGEYKG